MLLKHINFTPIMKSSCISRTHEVNLLSINFCEFIIFNIKAEEKRRVVTTYNKEYDLYLKSRFSDNEAKVNYKK